VGSAFVLPVFAMVLLSALVWLRLYQTRIGEMKRKRIHPQRVATSAADNFRNLFELPVLFYAAMLLVTVSRTESPVLLGLAWAFVALRYLHSYIHCTYNRVKDRFSVYLLSAIALWAVWAVMAYTWLH
jgi:hypothetical protein